MVVIDSNLPVTIGSGDLRGTVVLGHFTDWASKGVRLHAPELARYEFANALTRLIVANTLLLDVVEEALSEIVSLPVQYHHLSDAKRVIEIAITLGRQNAYDASYLALAEELGCELWTLDGPLYRNASGRGFSVQLIS